MVKRTDVGDLCTPCTGRCNIGLFSTVLFSCLAKQEQRSAGHSLLMRRDTAPTTHLLFTIKHFTIMTYEKFQNAWSELDTESKISLHNEYCAEHDADNEIFEFTDDFLNEMFSTPADCARAIFFGKIRNYCDPYVRFNGYANLVSMSEYEAEQFCEMFTLEIYTYQNIWSEYIEDEDEEDEE